MTTLALREDTVVINRLTGHIIIKVRRYRRAWRALHEKDWGESTNKSEMANINRAHRVGTRMILRDSWKSDTSD